MSIVLFCSSSVTTLAETLIVPSDTRIFISTKEEIIGKKGRIREGQRIRAQVWRDVVVNKRVVVAKGTPVLVKVDFFKKAKIAGRKGKISLGAYEVETVDGGVMQLNGGYFKEGKGRIALTATLAGIVFLPLIFIKGQKAKLPEGTVFDAYSTQKMDVAFAQDMPTQTIALSPPLKDIEAKIVYEALEGVEKPKYFPLSIRFQATDNPNFVVDTINGDAASKSLKLENVVMGACAATCDYTGDVPIKTLVKQFKKGLNTIEVAADKNGERVGAEILIDIEI